jgi:ribosome-binding protein aMBF1 (putative translation factor)
MIGDVMKKVPHPNPEHRGDKASERRLRERVEKKLLTDAQAAERYLATRITMQVAEMVRSRRVKAGLTQAALAERAGLTQPLVARVENPRAGKIPSLITVYKYALGLGLEPSIELRKPDQRRVVKKSVATA